MDLNIRKAGNLLLKASKEATPVVKALGTGIKAGGEAAITSYNNNLAKKSSSRTGQIHSSRNVESESENCNCLRLPATETVCNCLRNGKRQGLRSALNFCSNVS